MQKIVRQLGSLGQIESPFKTVQVVKASLLTYLINKEWEKSYFQTSNARQ